MGSPFYNKDKSKLQKPPKMQHLDEVVVNAPRYGSKAPMPKYDNVQRTLPSRPAIKEPTQKIKKDFKLPEPIKNDYIPPRPLPSTPKAKEFPIKNNERSVPILEAYTPPKFEGAKPLAQSRQRKIYSSFKEQMQQLKNK